MPDTQTTTTATTTTTPPTADDMSMHGMWQRTDTTLQKQVWHFVTVGVIAAVVVGFFLGRATK